MMFNTGLEHHWFRAQNVYRQAGMEKQEQFKHPHQAVTKLLLLRAIPG